MEIKNTKNSQEPKKLLFNIDLSNLRIENQYCPHIFNRFLNPYLNSKYEKINLSILESDSQKETDSQSKKEKDDKIIYSRNLSILQNPFKTFNYYGYSQSKNLLNSYLIQNFSLDWIIVNNPQNLSIKSSYIRTIKIKRYNSQILIFF